MKVKEVIALLRKEDPTGEEEVCIGNADVFAVFKEPWYYDGRIERLIRDPNKSGYNITGAYIGPTKSGYKITIRELSIEDVLWDIPDLEIIYAPSCKEYENKYEKLRLETKKAISEINKEVNES